MFSAIDAKDLLPHTYLLVGALQNDTLIQSAGKQITEKDPINLLQNHVRDSLASAGLCSSGSDATGTSGSTHLVLVI
jgi:hypothetical protein